MCQVINARDDSEEKRRTARLTGHQQQGKREKVVYCKRARHQNGAPLTLFQLVQLLIKIGDSVDALTSLRQPLMQQRVG